MPTALVTGAAGFIGSHLHKALLDKGNKVIAVDDLSTGTKANLDPRISQFIKTTSGHISPAQLENVDVVFHFGEMAAENLSLFAPDVFYLKNVQNTYSLLINCVKSKVKRFVYASSMAIYGDSPIPYNENNPINPSDPYGLAKFQGEQLGNIYAKLGAIEIVNTRLFNVYGPNMNLKDPYRGVIGIFITQLLNGKQPVIFGDGKQERAFTYIGDIIPPLVQLGFAKKPENMAINLGSSNLVAIEQVAKLVINLFDSKKKPRYFAKRLNEKETIYCSTDLAKRTLGFEAKTDIRSGLKETINWAKSVNPIPQFNYDLYPSISVLEQFLPTPWKKRTM